MEQPTRGSLVQSSSSSKNRPSSHYLSMGVLWAYGSGEKELSEGFVRTRPGSETSTSPPCALSYLEERARWLRSACRVAVFGVDTEQAEELCYSCRIVAILMPIIRHIDLDRKMAALPPFVARVAGLTRACVKVVRWVDRVSAKRGRLRVWAGSGFRAPAGSKSCPNRPPRGQRWGCA